MCQHHHLHQPCSDCGQHGHDMVVQAKQACERYMHVHVIAKTRDGSQFDGIVDGMDADGVIMLVAEDVDESAFSQPVPWRQLEYGRPRYRRYRRQRFPFSTFLFPFFVPYPYYYPGYPYPYPYPSYPYPPVVY